MDKGKTDSSHPPNHESGSIHSQPTSKSDRSITYLNDNGNGHPSYIIPGSQNVNPSSLTNSELIFEYLPQVSKSIQKGIQQLH